MPRGLFITLEGGEGTGKSTHAGLLAERIRQTGREVVKTREPGGTAQGEAIRSLLLGGEASRWSAEAEALLNYAARDAHLETVIRPALSRGAVVVCDRFMDSTRAYQQCAGGASRELIDALERLIVGRTRPGLTLVFDLGPESGLARAGHRGSADRFEAKGIGYHRKLREGFLAVARAEPQRCVVIDTSRDRAEVAEEVWRAVAPHLGSG